jgi:hypothetical protein
VSDSVRLDRDDLIDGLRELIREAHAEGLSGVTIRIIGGAALRLAHFDRDTTVDIDAQIAPLDKLQPIIDRMATSRGWPADWLNNNAAMFLPSWGLGVDWQTVFDDGDVSIAVAPTEALLAMKLLASRPGRDTPDITKLLALNEITSVEAAEELFEEFYPGDALPEKAIRLLNKIFEIGLPPKPSKPPAADFS